MEGEYICDVELSKRDFRKDRISDVTYDGCVFVGCNFGSCRFDGVRFLSCKFSACDFSLAAFGDTVLDDVKFSECKMLGLSFEGNARNAFAASFVKCILDNAEMLRVKAAGVKFDSCRMIDMVFTDSVLSKVVFGDCRMGGASFNGCDCTGADFSTSDGFLLDPESNRVKGAAFSLGGLPGLLSKYKIKII